MKTFNIAVLGFGSVGQSFVRLLLRKKDLLNGQYNLGYSISGIATAHHGMAIDPDGIDGEQALHLIASGGRLDGLSQLPQLADPLQYIRKCEADVLLEDTPVSYADGQPAVSYLQAALQAGMHAITANKGPVVHAFRELTSLAEAAGRKFYFESAVMDGAPIFSLFRQTLPAAHLEGFSGILNSTTNLVLKRMEGGETLEQAIGYAQSIGIAETDPSGDIDGWDASVKVAALVTVLMGIPLKPAQVDRTGIRLITSQDIQRAKQAGKRWKLVCSAKRMGEAVTARVVPQMVGTDSPLYGVDGTSSIVTFETDVLPGLSIVEGNPGPETTAYGLLADFINATR
jgi:homoserine dehydrogenase